MGEGTEIKVDGYNVVLCRFPKDAVSAVICGAVAALKLENQLNEWCGASGVPYFKATISEAEYRLEILPYSDYPLADLSSGTRWGN